MIYPENLELLTQHFWEMDFAGKELRDWGKERMASYKAINSLDSWGFIHSIHSGPFLAGTTGFGDSH